MNILTPSQMMEGIIKLVAKRSKCKRHQVSAIIVKQGRIVSMGYNGPPSGYPICDSCKGPGCNVSCHAESNAISFAARSGISTEGATMYTLLAPCTMCAKMILHAGISKLNYYIPYRDDTGVILLQSCGVSVNLIESEININEFKNTSKM